MAATRRLRCLPCLLRRPTLSPPYVRRRQTAHPGHSLVAQPIRPTATPFWTPLLSPVAAGGVRSTPAISCEARAPQGPWTVTAQPRRLPTTMPRSSSYRASSASSPCSPASLTHHEAALPRREQLRRGSLPAILASCHIAYSDSVGPLGRSGECAAKAFRPLLL